jgi:C4-dicarboxylate-specific signal transduction histidine kinase
MRDDTRRVVADADDDALEAQRLVVLGRLLPGALHELANPVLALRGTVELLLQERDPASARDRLEVVAGMTGEIEDVVRTLQRLAREGAEPRTAVALATFVDDTAAVTRRFTSAKDVALDVRASGSATVEARPGRLRTALLGSLLDALASAGPKGRVELRVDGPRVLLDGTELRLPTD